jgi:hypothetical protein
MKKVRFLFSVIIIITSIYLPSICIAKSSYGVYGYDKEAINRQIDAKMHIYPGYNCDPKMLISANPDIDPKFLVKP